MNYFEKNKDTITSVAALFGITFSIVALAFTVYSLVPKPKSPLLVLQLANLSSGYVRAVTYNGGNAPCAEFEINYPSEIGTVEQIVQYQESVITNAKIIDGKLTLPPFLYNKVGICSNNSCSVFGGFLKPNQVFALRIMPKVDKFEISAKCIDDSGSITAHYEKKT